MPRQHHRSAPHLQRPARSALPPAGLGKLFRLPAWPAARPPQCLRRLPPAGRRSRPAPAAGRAPSACSRSQALLRRRDAAALVSRWRRRPGPPAAAIDLSRARPAIQHVLVPDRLPGVAGARRRAAGSQRRGTAALSAVAPTLEAFFTQRLMSQKRASRHTIAAYRDGFRLLLAFAQDRSGKAPSQLEIYDLDAPAIGAFLDYLERGRGNSAQSRNARLAAIHSLFRFAALRHPEHAALIARVLAIPPKRTERAVVQFLSEDEIDALLASPGRSRWIGRRDHALLLVAIETGLRVSELAGLRCRDVVLGSGAHVRCFGK